MSDLEHYFLIKSDVCVNVNLSGGAEKIKDLCSGGHEVTNDEGFELSPPGIFRRRHGYAGSLGFIESFWLYN
ncbi:hypothetical protein QVD17_30142 [Tagetes erecta]|uniref:Uncharacterized protein n=1 Tax=Tagetes erecta TaxID=13708 RepID=A0AAD8K2Z6_TARER|nr:hypothetical protein QVD17_30142 [Tagetes erecta]